jgi:hypothetical protein
MVFVLCGEYIGSKWLLFNTLKLFVILKANCKTFSIQNTKSPLTVLVATKAKEKVGSGFLPVSNLSDTLTGHHL